MGELRLQAGIENSDNSRFCTDLELVRPIYFAENMFLSVRKIALFVYLSEFNFDRLLLLAHLSRRLIGELIVYPWSGVGRRRPQCSNIFFSETAWPIKAKFYVEHPWVGGT